MDARVLHQAYLAGQKAALSKFADWRDKAEWLASPEGMPYAGAGLSGAGAGLWDLLHGRGLAGSVGTAVGTGGGGILGGLGGKMLAQRFHVDPYLGQMGGTLLGGLLGRKATEPELPPSGYGR